MKVELMRRLLRKRLGQRGAVAVEFAFSLFFLVPLLLGTLDYGYYFWIAVNAVQAANAGLRAAASTPGIAPGCNLTAPSTAAVAAATITASNAVTAQLTGGPVGHPRTPLTTANITLLYNRCVTPPTGATDPNWQIQVQVDFVPVVGFVNPWMPRNGLPAPAAGMVRFRSPILFSGIP
jgi:Flp pilus assembly protein TadG